MPKLMEECNVMKDTESRAADLLSTLEFVRTLDKKIPSPRSPLLSKKRLTQERTNALTISQITRSQMRRTGMA